MAEQASTFDPREGAAGGDLGPDVNGQGQSAPERPEVLVGAAFAGGLALALVLRWLGPDRD
jgi:hypothetical protein